MAAIKNKLLTRQINRFFTHEDKIPQEMLDFLRIVEETYSSYDENIELLQNSIEISSTELRSAYRRQQDDIAAKQKLIEQIQEAIITLKDDHDDLEKEIVAGSFDSGYLINILLKHIEEKKANEIKLRKLSQAVEQSSASVIITNLNGEIEYVNQKFTESSGYSLEEMMGKNPAILKSGAQSEEFYRNLWETITSGKTWRGELQNKKKNGELYWESVSISSIITSEGKTTHYLAIKDDITARKQAEAELKLAKEQAEAANRAKSEFLASISHEIRTPMNSILGFSEVLLNTTDNPKQKNFLATILSSGKTLLLLINDILDLSKIEAGRMEISPEPADLRLIVNEMKHIFDHKTKEKNIGLFVEVEDNIPKAVIIDEIRFRQILFNLTGNAIKFTHQGFVKIKIRLLEQRSGSIDFEVSVIDTGIGVAENDQKRIFESFTQQSGQDTRKYAGTGLGLAITKRLCELMNGEIGLESHKGTGSRFYARFYTVKFTQEVIGQDDFYSWDDDELVFKGSRILLVDDVNYNRDLVIAYLEGYNLRLAEAENGEMAAELIKNYDFDLVIMDIRMPGMDGYEATELIRSIKGNTQIPVIALTASTMNSDFGRIQKLFDGYLCKPVQKKSLINEIIKFLPFDRIEKQSGAEQPASENDTTHAAPGIPAEVKHLFRKELSQDLDKQAVYMIIDELESLVEKLTDFAERHNVSLLQSKTKELKECIELFDFDKIHYCLTSINKLFDT